MERLIDLLFAVLGAYAIVLTLTEAAVFERVREKAGGMFDCPFCTTWWVSLCMACGVSGDFLGNWVAVVGGTAIIWFSTVGFDYERVDDPDE